ncbi:MAG: methyltransferase, partial [Candidatus Lokiarchaeota archaeon]
MTKVLEPIIKYYNKDIYYPSDDSYLILDYFKEKVVDNKIYKKLKQNVNYILDMGTGLGLFAIFFAMFARSDKFFNPKIYACDILEKALIYAQKNATFNQVEHDILFVLSDLFKNFSSDLKGKFDIIIFNPAVNEPVFFLNTPETHR